MNPTAPLRAAHRTPLIKFVGKHRAPTSVNHAPEPHPASPTHTLPGSFAAYRKKAQQHGPLNGGSSVPMNKSFVVGGHIGSHSGSELGRVAPAPGQLFDRSELPKRFQRLALTEGELEAIESGGATRVW